MFVAIVVVVVVMVNVIVVVVDVVAMNIVDQICYVNPRGRNFAIETIAPFGMKTNYFPISSCSFYRTHNAKNNNSDEMF